MQFDKRIVAQRRQPRDEEEGRLSDAFEDCREKEHAAADQFLHPRHSMLYPAYVILRDALQAIRAQCSKKYLALTTYRKRMRHEENNAEPKARASGIGGNEMNMPHVTPTPKLDDAPQPPLAYPGATPASDRTQRPPLTISPTHEELNPGDRVMGVEDSGKAFPLAHAYMTKPFTARTAAFVERVSGGRDFDPGKLRGNRTNGKRNLLVA